MKHAFFVVPLAAAMLLAGCADWHWYRMDGKDTAVAPAPKPKPKLKTATAQAPAPSTTSAPAPSAISAPASVAAPAPTPASAPAPKPRPASVSNQSLDQQIVGRWRRPGDASCAAGPQIENDHGKLLITTDGQKSVHKLEGMNSRRILTHVIEPAGGPRYRLRIVKGGGDAERPFTLDVQNVVTGGTVNWTPCTVS